MVIKEIYMYQYGKWSDTHFKELPSFMLFHGENEAGKSTITAFILSILFGFPAKRDDRFKSPSSSEFGGALLIECPIQGKFRIERLYGKKGVTVLFEDGTAKDEAWLKKWLGGVERSLYEKIYFFDLDGLQNVHKIQAEDITRYLLSASTIGSEKLFAVENELIKLQEALFKPQGRNPVMNQNLTVLADLDAKVKAKKKEMDQYDLLLQEKQQLLERESDLKQELKANSHDIEKENAWFAAIPLVIKANQWIDKLKEYESLSFPENGLERWKEWNHALKPLTAQEISLKEQLEQAEATVSMLAEPVLLQEKNNIEALLDQSTIFLREQERKRQLQTKLKYIGEGLQEHKQLLGISDFHSFQWNPSSIKEAEIRVEKWNHLQKLFHEKEKKYKLEQQRKTITQAKLNQLQSDMLSPLQLELEEGMLLEWETIKTIENEKKIILTEMSLIEQEKARISKKNHHASNIENLLMGIISLISLAGLAVSIGQQQWLFALICGLLILTVGVTFFYRKRNHSNYLNEYNRSALLKERLRQLEDKEKDFTCTEERCIEASEKIEEHQRITDKMKETQTALKEQSWFAGELEKERLDLLDQLQSVQMSLIQLYHSNTGKGVTDLDRLSFELPIIQAIYQHLKEKVRLEEEIEEIKLRMEPLQNHLQAWAKKLQLSGSYPEWFGLLKDQLEREKEQEQSRKYLQEGINKLKQQLKKIEAEKSLVKAELASLLEKAKCGDEESYLKKGFLHEEKLKLQDQLEAVQDQLRRTSFSEEERNQRSLDQDKSRSRLEGLEAKQRALTEELDHVRKQVASIEYQLKQMEEGGSYIDLLYQFYQARHSFQEAAKTWSVYTIARGLLREAMIQFKEGTFPKVLQNAEAIFKALTNENYEKIRFSSEKEELSVLHKSGKWFPAGALSQATKEQVYVSIRFGLIEALYPALSLPIIIDDSFVNFDPDRVTRVMETLKALSRRHQVIVFSCHPEMAQYFSQDQVVELRKYQPKVVR